MLPILVLSFGDEDEGPLFPFSYSFIAKVLDDPDPYYSLWYFTGDDKTQITPGTFGCGFYPDSIVDSAPVPGFLSNGFCPGAFDEHARWNITKLTAHKMWLKTTFNNKNYEVHLREL
ncbi:MAG TPA: hypothetical protein VE978_24525 [Chitinophagales bacterium]|nr:hypothetical protein [Chitinophagales bacterium]